MSGPQIADFFRRLKGYTSQRIDGVPSSLLRFLRDVLLQGRRRKKKAEHLRRLELRKRAFQEDLRCSTPVGPVPLENCLSICEIPAIQKTAPVEPARKAKDLSKKWSPIPSDNESSTFLHNWEKILREMGAQKYLTTDHRLPPGLPSLDSL